MWRRLREQLREQLRAGSAGSFAARVRSRLASRRRRRDARSLVDAVAARYGIPEAAAEALIERWAGMIAPAGRAGLGAEEVFRAQQSWRGRLHGR